MATIHYDGQDYECAPDETILECLDRHGCAPASSCKSGICQTCMMRASSGAIPEEAQAGLNAAQKENGYLLTCICKPSDDLTLVVGDGAARHEGVITQLDPLNEFVVRVRIQVAGEFQYRAGQFINLVGPNGNVRSYSIASVHSADEFIELHVALMAGGIVSGWLHSEAKHDDPVQFFGPQGNCFYTDDAANRPLLLAGTGTGLAPLYGILRDALHRGHSEPIHLFHGSVRASGLYLVENLRALAAAHPNLSYYPCALQPEDAPDDIPVAPIDAYIAETLPKLDTFRVYLCGHPDTVRSLQRKSFLAGASLADIFADAFLPAAQ